MSWFFVFLVLFMIPFDVYRNRALRNFFKRYLFRRSVPFVQDNRKGYGPITIYVLSVLDSVDNERGVVQVAEGGERRVLYSDRDCQSCNSTLKWTERRLFHKTGSECYVCYREKVDSLNTFIYFLIMQIPELDRDTKGLVFEIYAAIREETLLLDNGTLAYDKIFEHFPRLLLPYKNKDGQLEWKVSGEMWSEQYLLRVDRMTNEVTILGIEYEGVFHQEKHQFPNLLEACRFVVSKMETVARAT